MGVDAHRMPIPLAFMEDLRTRFGRIVRERRNYLGLKQQDVFALGGPSDTTQSRVEKGEGAIPSVSTRNSYDIPLRWPVGTAARVWSGDEPPPNDDSPEPAASGSNGAVQLPEILQVPSSHLISLTQALTRLQTALGRSDLSAAEFRAAVAPTAEDLKTTVSSIARTWIIGVIEQNQGLSAGPALMAMELMFGEVLAAPVDMSAPDVVEQQYARWLANKHDSLDPGLEAAFERRLQGARGSAALRPSVG